MSFPTSFNMDNGVLRSQRARGRFLLTIFYVYGLVGNRDGSERRVGCEGLEIAHNGVRGDNDVEVGVTRE
jgi:hypothetical protein